jgi:hypothetical protein
VAITKRILKSGSGRQTNERDCSDVANGRQSQEAAEKPAAEQNLVPQRLKRLGKK